MSSKQLFGYMGAAVGVASGVIGGLAWSSATANAAHTASVTKKAKEKAQAVRRIKAAALAKVVKAHKARAEKLALAAKKRRDRKKQIIEARTKTPRTFQRMFRVKATAYSPINTRMEGGRWTATQGDGRSVHGVAVDPNLIPLGTHLWVPGYGHAVADDTGGAIKGHHIDVRLQNRHAMSKWGVRKLCVYVLEGPPRKLRRAM